MSAGHHIQSQIVSDLLKCPSTATNSSSFKSHTPKSNHERWAAFNKLPTPELEKRLSSQSNLLQSIIKGQLCVPDNGTRVKSTIETIQQVLRSRTLADQPRDSRVDLGGLVDAFASSHISSECGPLLAKPPSLNAFQHAFQCHQRTRTVALTDEESLAYLANTISARHQDTPLPDTQQHMVHTSEEYKTIHARQLYNMSRAPRVVKKAVRFKSMHEPAVLLDATEDPQGRLDSIDEEHDDGVGSSDDGYSSDESELNDGLDLGYDPAC